jgi:hypothetical protein
MAATAVSGIVRVHNNGGRHGTSDEHCLWAGTKRDGETGIRTRDTTIFSRVLYQLSYLAAGHSSPAPMLPAPRSSRGNRACPPKPAPA